MLRDDRPCDDPRGTARATAAPTARTVHLRHRRPAEPIRYTSRALTDSRRTPLFRTRVLVSGASVSFRYRWARPSPIPSPNRVLTVLLDGFIEQRREDDDRSVFTFLRSLFANPWELRQVLMEYDLRAYPGNHAIPDPICDTNTFAGEIPWSGRFAYPLRAHSGASHRQVVKAFEAHGSQAQEGVPVELPVAEFLWEGSRDSSVGNVLTATVPSPALCERLGLVNHTRQFDLYDGHGALASICIFRDQGEIRAQFAYIREDLLNRYASETGQIFSWLVWGERTPRPGVSEDLIGRIPRSVYSSHAHIHKQSYLWNGHAPEARIG